MRHGRATWPAAAAMVMVLAATGAAAGAKKLNNWDSAGSMASGTVPFKYTPTGKSLFIAGCPAPGRAMAMKIMDPRMGMDGPDALGGAGDYLLMNGKSAFIVEGVDRINTYYYYGGILMDAVALNGCSQAVPEAFEELGFFVGSWVHGDPKASGIRAFHGEKVEVLRDGSDGGPAVVRATGVDDMFWIEELELMRMTLQLGLPKERTRPLGIKIYVDYILEPDSSVLKIEYNMVNQDPTPKHLLTAAGGFFGDSTVNHYYYDHMADLAGFDLATHLPYLVASGGHGAWAFGMDHADMATTNFAGFDAFLDLHQLWKRLDLGPAGGAHDRARVTYYMAVGGGAENSALKALDRANPRPLRGWNMKLKPISGWVKDSSSGAGIEGVEVQVEKKNRKGRWTFLDGFVTDGEGHFAGMAPDLGAWYRLTGSIQGRTDAAPVYFRMKDAQDLKLTMDPPGALRFDVRDQDGRGLPARICLYQGDQRMRTILSVHGTGTAAVAPGSYEVIVTRGYEYEPYDGKIEVKPGETAELKAVLVHALDTSGYLSVDMHVHAGPSGDNKISIPDRIATVAAEGLEVVVSTDHEAIIPWQPGLAAAGLSAWVSVVTGEEVTATVPEHMNAFPFTPRFDLDARGGPVKWQGLDMAQVIAASRARGARIVQLNHPRNDCQYMCLIDYDRATGQPRLTHPEYLGLPPDATLWSWDFDTFEYLNGNDPVFVDKRGPKASGTFEDWMSFINLGHRITAVANTDAHDFRPPGEPRNYFPSSTDDPAKFNLDELVSALKGGRTLMSTGSFARVKINGTAGMGDTAVAMGDTVDLWLVIESIPQIDVTHFKVFVNCDQVMNVELPPGSGVVRYDGHLKVPVHGDSQVVVMGFGDHRLPRNLPQFDPRGVPRFTTNPIYIDRGGDGYHAPGWDGCTYTLP